MSKLTIYVSVNAILGNIKGESWCANTSNSNRPNSTEPLGVSLHEDTLQTLKRFFNNRASVGTMEAFPMDEGQVLAQIWDFLKSLASDSSAPWINRFLPHLIVPSIRRVHPIFQVIRSAVGTYRTTITSKIRGIAQSSRHPVMWPIPIVLLAGIAPENTQWGMTAQMAGGAVIFGYLTLIAYVWLRSGIGRVVRR